MSIRRRFLVLATLLVMAGASHGQDLRDRFNKPNLEAGKAIEQAISAQPGQKARGSFESR